ncbi:MAG: TolC family protein [Acidobacteriota bacterium]|nr:TolC family protein [Acidobacteriota bacterium]MDH3528351.1 TolC family protein [Acidobacteriota bacterium]
MRHFMFADIKIGNRKSLTIRLLVSLFLVLSSVSVIRAQSALIPELDLEDAVKEAFGNNPQIKVSESKTRIAEAQIKEARTGKQPSVLVTQSAIRSNNPVFVFGSLLEQGRFGASNFAVDSLNHPSGLFNFRSSIEATIPILDQNQTRSRITRSEINKKRTELNQESVRQQLRFDVIRSFYGAIVSKEMLQVNREAVRSARANRKKAKDMVELGMTTNADFLAAEVELSNADQLQLESESNLITSMAALNVTLGDEPDLERVLTGSLPEKFFPIESQEDLIRIAFENRPDYQIAELNVESAASQLKSIKDQKLPRVDAFGNFGYSSPYAIDGSSDYTVGVKLTFTLYDAGRNARIEQSSEGETVARLEKEQLGNQIRLEVIRALQNHKTAGSGIKVYIQTIAHAEEALRIVQDRYTHGLTTFNEVINRESALVRARQGLLAARFRHYLSYASVLLATGRLTGVGAFE